ncbi:MAG: hypothetical protein AAF202_13725, partial [Pseudomonadota bacterium]
DLFNAGFGFHVIGIPNESLAKDKLYVHLVGSAGKPYSEENNRFSNEAIVEEAMSQGFSVIMPAYNNRFPVNSRQECGEGRGQRVQNCAGKTREEKIFGRNTSPRVDVPRADSISQRLKDIVKFGAARDWRLLGVTDVGGNLDLQHAHIGGHSQGSGHALYIAKTQKVKQACLLAGVADRPDLIPSPEFGESDGVIADWLQDSGYATPNKKIRAVFADSDKGVESLRRTHSMLGVQVVELKEQKFKDSAGEEISGHAAPAKASSLKNLRKWLCFKN